jgi:proliferating cell nuclear antigen
MSGSSLHGSRLLTCPSDVKALFSIDYLADVGKSAGKAEQITMDIGNDLPLQLSHSIACGNGSVMYVIAPRVENN